MEEVPVETNSLDVPCFVGTSRPDDALGRRRCAAAPFFRRIFARSSFIGLEGCRGKAQAIRSKIAHCCSWCCCRRPPDTCVDWHTRAYQHGSMLPSLSLYGPSCQIMRRALIYHASRRYMNFGSDEDTESLGGRIRSYCTVSWRRQSCSLGVMCNSRFSAYLQPRTCFLVTERGERFPKMGVRLDESFEREETDLPYPLPVALEQNTSDLPPTLESLLTMRTLCSSRVTSQSLERADVMCVSSPRGLA